MPIILPDAGVCEEHQLDSVLRGRKAVNKEKTNQEKRIGTKKTKTKKNGKPILRRGCKEKQEEEEEQDGQESDTGEMKAMRVNETELLNIRGNAMFNLLCYLSKVEKTCQAQCRAICAFMRQTQAFIILFPMV